MRECIIRKSDGEEVALKANEKTVLEDIGHNADLYLVYRQSRGQHKKLDEPDECRVLGLGGRWGVSYFRLLKRIKSRGL